MLNKILLSTALFVCGVISYSKISVNTATRQFQDEYGRAVLFHGVNVAYKVDPYIPSNSTFDADLSLTDFEIDQIKAWGFNFVRLAVMWEAVEREKGQFNDTYLDAMDVLISKLGQRGIYTLVDAHQDVLARRLCGEGIPNFYAIEADLPSQCSPGILPYLFPFLNFCKSIKDYGLRYDADGNPLIEDCQKNSFGQYYFSPESMALFEQLYSTEKGGLQEKFLAYWVKVSQRFANNPYVIGYDPINEPFPSNIYKDSSLFVTPGRFDLQVLQPLYKRVFEESYLPNDQSKLMFFEPTQVPDLFFKVGFTEVPGGQNYTHLHVLNDHTYGPCALGDLNDTIYPLCREYHELKLSQRDNDAKTLNVPLIISEFGACLGGETCVTEITAVADVCDEKLSSWAYWQLKKYGDLTTTAGTGSEGFYNEDGTLQADKVKALTRTYIQSTQGTLVSNRFDSNTTTFVGSFVANTQLSQPSVVYWNQEYWFTNGINFQVTDVAGKSLIENQDYQLDLSENNYAKLLITNPYLNGKIIQVIVTKKGTTLSLA